MGKKSDVQSLSTQSSGECLAQAFLLQCRAHRHCCNAQSSQPWDKWPVCSYTFAVKFLCACSHQLHEVAQVLRCIWCQTCCMQVEGLYKVEVQGPGPPGTALLHAMSRVWQGFLTSGQGQKILELIIEEGGGLRSCSQAPVLMSADMSPHPHGGQGLNLSLTYAVA